MTSYVMDIGEPKRGDIPPTTWMGTIKNHLKRKGLQPKRTQLSLECRKRQGGSIPKNMGNKETTNIIFVSSFLSIFWSVVRPA